MKQGRLETSHRGYISLWNMYTLGTFLPDLLYHTSHKLLLQMINHHHQPQQSTKALPMCRVWSFFTLTNDNSKGNNQASLGCRETHTPNIITHHDGVWTHMLGKWSDAYSRKCVPKLGKFLLYGEREIISHHHITTRDDLSEPFGVVKHRW